ncbi:GIY-YIG nuclease family protein [Clostridium perfringens]|uniref:GIY-YIG nuclease family protein n=1 Tax=Clostridium perfringens TaxID=1502 RepID=UPI0018E40034|nr:GIY-YIG nuclease family protein [Clostridium perfringens]MBI6065014.1 GIY-YIG nuclease family protein [Clostridium perfringens]
MSNILKEGQVFKNWKEVCNHFGWKETRGSYKGARVKLFSTMYKWHKEGNKIIIDEVYGNNGYEIRVGKKRLISDEFYKEFNTSGIYILSDKFDKIYIGSSKNVYERFIEHRKKDEGSRSTQLDKDSIKIEMIDITRGIEDIEFLCELKKIAIEEFIKAGLDLVNRITGVEKERVKKEKFKTIKVKSDAYEQTIEILKINGLVA